MRKKLALITIILLWSFSAFADKFPFVGEVTKEGVNVRSGPNINFESLYQAKNGDKVTVKAKSYDWYQIDLPSEVVGFISKKYVKTATEGNGEVIGDRVNIRAKPGDKYTIIGQAKKGQAVTITGSTGDWFSIAALENCRGWTHENFVKFFSDYIKEEIKPLPPSEPSVVSEDKVAKSVSEEKTTKATEELKVEPSVQQEKQFIEVEGVLEQRGKTLGKRFGTHKLLVDGRLAYYLEGDSAILNSYIHFKVMVTGGKTTTPKGGIPVIKVEKITPSK